MGLESGRHPACCFLTEATWHQLHVIILYSLQSKLPESTLNRSSRRDVVHTVLHLVNSCTFMAWPYHLSFLPFPLWVDVTYVETSAATGISTVIFLRANSQCCTPRGTLSQGSRHVYCTPVPHQPNTQTSLFELRVLHIQ